MTPVKAGGDRALFEIPNPFLMGSGVAKLLEPAGSCSETLRAGLRDGSYSRPFVLERGGVRSLYFSLRFIQSSMRIAEPDALDLSYTRKMMAFLLFNARPKNLLLIGLGGGSLAKFCHRHLPRAGIVVVEIDSDVIALREEFLVPPDDARFKVVHADGAEYVGQRAVRADVLMVDAFDGEGVAPSLAQPVFFRDAFNCLSGKGILVMNIAGDKAGYAAHLANLRQAFGGQVFAMPVKEDGNFVAFAFKNPHFAPHWKSLKADAQALQSRFGLEFPYFVQQLECGDKHRLVRG